MMTLMTVMTLTVVMMMRVFTWKVCQDDQHSSTRRMTIMTGLSLQQLELSFHPAKTKYSKVWSNLQPAGDTSRCTVMCLDILEMKMRERDRESSRLYPFCSRAQSCQLQMENMSNCHPLSPPVSPSDQRLLRWREHFVEEDRRSNHLWLCTEAE